MKSSATLRQSERGAVLVWMALMIVVLLGMAAFAVDLGMNYAVKRQLSSTADATALAGAQEAGLVFDEDASCVLGEPSTELKQAIEDVVDEVHGANDPWGSTGAPTIDDGSLEVECTTDRVTVRTTEKSSLDTFFASILGVATLSPAESAAATVTGYNEQEGLRPFTVCLSEAKLAEADGATHDSIYASFNDDPPTELVGTGPWSTGGVIDIGENHNLYPADFVRLSKDGLEPNGAIPGYYYVVSTPSAQTLTVSTTVGGTQQTIDTAGRVNVYKVTGGLVASNARWATSDSAIVATGPQPGDEIRIVVRSGADGALPGIYYVKAVSGGRFTVSTTDEGPAQSITENGRVDVYEPFTESDAAGACVGSLGASGNWGYARFGLGPSDTNLKCLVEYGYGPDCNGDPRGVDLGDDDESTPEVTSVGYPGNSIGDSGGPASYPVLLDALVNETITLPVSEVWSEGGANANYTAKGGIVVNFCGYIFPRNDNNPEPAEWYGRTDGNTVDQQGDCWDPNLYPAAVAADRMDKASLYIQWVYEDKPPPGLYIGQSSDNTCGLGNVTCRPTVQLIE